MSTLGDLGGLLFLFGALMSVSFILDAAVNSLQTMIGMSLVFIFALSISLMAGFILGKANRVILVLGFIGILLFQTLDAFVRLMGEIGRIGMLEHFDFWNILSLSIVNIINVYWVPGVIFGGVLGLILSEC